MSAVLVTGGGGYTGSHAVKARPRRGDRVVVFDTAHRWRQSRPRRSDDRNAG